VGSGELWGAGASTGALRAQDLTAKERRTLAGKATKSRGVGPSGAEQSPAQGGALDNLGEGTRGHAAY